MHPLIRATVKKLKLLYLWITRILLAPNTFGVPLHTRLWYAVSGGFIPDQYVLYNLKQGTAKEYLSEFDWYRSRWINEPFDPMLNNKVVANEVLAPHTRVPKVFFIRNRGHITSYESPEAHHSIDNVLTFLQEEGSAFLKPIGMGKGRGVHRIDSTDEGFVIDAQAATDSDVRTLLASTDGWFLSETIKQHPDLTEIFPETTNTVRLITLRDPDTGTPKPFFAVLRIGSRATIPVDNGSRGGFVAQIDMSTGTVSEARTLWSTDSYTHHPDSGHRIEGIILPYWPEIRESVLDLTHRLPYLRIVAWDILITSLGFCIIEANTSTGVNIIQLWGGQRHGELGNFYRAHGVKV